MEYFPVIIITMIILRLTSILPALTVKQLFLNDFQASLSLTSTLLTFHSSRSLLITPLHVFVDCPLAEPPPMTNF